ncbi:beta-ketoacyl synthase N-terminal-like domain-containing protein [Streptomyces sp. NPDC029216]|uniref:beta-ketoacyl synthase N-terminal-like domain-containing protein n=1 Tax=Streptomyces sp. NPDC029216 TaxID=3154701 RepID=UPI0033EBFA25
MNGPAIAVTGLGMLTPAGIGVEATWEGVLDGKSTAATSDQPAGLPVDFCCSLPHFDAAGVLGRRTAHRLDRSSRLAVIAAKEALGLVDRDGLGTQGLGTRRAANPNPRPILRPASDPQDDDQPTAHRPASRRRGQHG